MRWRTLIVRTYDVGGSGKAYNSEYLKLCKAFGRDLAQINLVMLIFIMHKGMAKKVTKDSAVVKNIMKKNIVY